MNGIDLANQYRENKAKIAAVWDELKKFKDAKDAEISALNRAYREKKWVLEDEERKAENKLKQDKEEREDVARFQVDALEGVVVLVDRILYFLKLKPDITWKEEVLKAYEEKELVRLGALYQDEFLDMRLYVVENARPKNRYTLVVKGRCAFGAPLGWEPSSILELPRGYVRMQDYGAGDNVESILAHLPSIDDAEKYVAKHSKELMRNFLEKYQAVKQEYLEAIKNYKLEDFAGIEPLRVDMSYQTVFDELVKLEHSAKPHTQVTLTFKNGSAITIFDPDNLLLLQPGDVVEATKKEEVQTAPAIAA